MGPPGRNDSSTRRRPVNELWESYWSCELTLLILSIHLVLQSADQNHECENCGGEQQPSFHAGSPSETVELAM